MNELLRERTMANGVVLQLVQGDITRETVDAIVNAANAHLQHGGGVAGVIARRGGPVIQEESDAWVRTHGPVSHEEPAYTQAGRLPCRYVIHAVGPVWGSGDEDRKLAAAVQGSLRRATELGLQSIAMPAISTGIFGFPKKRAAAVMFDALDAWLTKKPSGSLQLVRIVLYDHPTLEAFVQVWDERFAEAA